MLTAKLNFTKNRISGQMAWMQVYECFMFWTGEYESLAEKFP